MAQADFIAALGCSFSSQTDALCMGGDPGLHVKPAFPSSKCALPPQLINQGPSSISQGVLEISCPQALEGQQLLYVTKVTGLSNCTSNYTPNSQGLEVRTWSS